MNLPKSLLIAGGRVIDPANGLDAVADVLILEGKIAATGPAPARKPRRGQPGSRRREWWFAPG